MRDTNIIRLKISEMKRLIAKATEGPICSRNGCISSVNPKEIQWHLDRGRDGYSHVEYYGGACIAESMSEGDSEFYASARKNIEYLIEVVEEFLDPALLESGVDE